MKLLDYFDTFLRETVNLDQTRLDQLDGRVDSITNALRAYDDLEGRISGTARQGSWAHGTIIKPADGHQFDADFLVLHYEDPAITSPKMYSNEILVALKDHVTYGPKTACKDRCVRVTYANDCHIDVVPCVVMSDRTYNIINRAVDEFEETNPEGFSEWLRERDSQTNGTLRRVIRLLKYLRDHREEFRIKSVLLTTLVGETLDRWIGVSDPDRYTDVPTALVNIVEHLDRWLQSRPYKPHLCDPSCPETSFDHRWTQAQYSRFRDDIHGLAPRLRAALDEPDQSTSISKWRALFGANFPSSVSASASLVKAAGASPLRAPHEEFITDRFPLAIVEDVEIEEEIVGEFVINRETRRSRGPGAYSVKMGKNLIFRAKNITVAPPYDVYWKVRNTGEVASRLNALRGQIVKDNGTESKDERSEYPGDHYVACYVIKDGKCVAMDRRPVHID
jgi:hypothetical protein